MPSLDSRLYYVLLRVEEEERTMVQPHHHHHDGTKSTDEPSYNIFRDSLSKFNMLIKDSSVVKKLDDVHKM